MSYRTHFSSARAAKPIGLALCIAGAAFGAGPALADKDDQTRLVNLSFDRRGEIDLARGRTEIVGDVVLSQGSTLLRAERADLYEAPDGSYRAVASGTSSRQVSFRQGREAPGACVAGSADQLDYDSRSSTVRLLGNARMQQVHSALVTREVTGASVVYDKRADLLTIEGGSKSPNPKGRGRIVWMPPASDPMKGDALNASALELQPTLTLGPKS